MDASAMYRRFVAAAARAGLGRLRFHDLRHTFGTTMAANPRVDLRRLQEWMGHADMTTTQRYSHFHAASRRRRARRRGVRDQRPGRTVCCAIHCLRSSWSKSVRRPTFRNGIRRLRARS